MSEILIDATEAKTSKTFLVNVLSGAVTLVANGLSSGEEIDVQMRYDDTNFCDVYNSSEEQVTLKSTSNVIVFDIPGYYQIVKPATSNKVTVSAFWSKY